MDAHRHTLMLANPGGAEAFGFNRILLMDRHTGVVTHFDTGATRDPRRTPDRSQARHRRRFLDYWDVVGLDDGSNRSINLRSSRLVEGPLLRAELDIPLPLGLHGTFIAATELA